MPPPNSNHPGPLCPCGACFRYTNIVKRVEARQEGLMQRAKRRDLRNERKLKRALAAQGTRAIERCRELERTVAALRADNERAEAELHFNWKGQLRFVLAAVVLVVVLGVGVVWAFVAADTMVKVERARIAELEAELARPLWCDCSLELAVAEDLAYVNERLAHGCAGLDWARRILTLDSHPPAGR